MKYIKKGTEPTSLKYHRSQPFADYDNYKEKDDLRNAILEEQGYLCCYCMQRIRIKEGELLEHKMKIEHWKPQSLYDHLQLDYKNLFGACLGNKGQPKHLEHCDTKKGDELITINPTDPVCEAWVKYSSSGEISSDEMRINNDLNITLNLNVETLVKNRKRVLDEALKNFYQNHPQSTWTKAILEREIRKWSPTKGPYKEYCQIVVFHLKKKLAKVSQ